MGSDKVRVAAVSDLHYGRTGMGPILPLIAKAAEQADILVLCGDLTDHGLPEEARGLAKELAAFKLPMVAVLGNHDYESDKVDDLKTIFCDARIRLLDGEAAEIRGVGFAGVKGFCGGFGSRMLGPWGESAIKAFVREALDEALKLETALSKLRGVEHRVAVLHYAPVESTVAGEPKEIYPFLGSTRLEEPINRHGADVVFHGHAHHGTHAGRTMSGIPVYNVSVTLMQQAFPDRPPFKVVEFPAAAQASARAPAEAEAEAGARA